MIQAGDSALFPDPDDIDTGTDERYLDLIPTDAVIAAAKKVLVMSKFRLALGATEISPGRRRERERLSPCAQEALDDSNL